jgi:hypothetical protein
MSVSIVLSQILLPQASVKLGRLITSVDQPHQNYHDPPLARQPNVLVSLRDSYTGEHHTTINSGFSSTLTSLMSAGFSKRARTKIRVTTDHVKTYTLDNCDGWFDEITSLPATRSWIEGRLDQDHDIYMIVGFHTVTNAIISQESNAGKSAAGQIKAPVGLSLTAAGVIAPLGSILDPGVSVHQQVLDGFQSRFVARGEQVCALEYRKVCHRWLSSKHVDNCRLSNMHQWTSMDRWRDEGDGEDDIVEVELTKLQDLGDDWDKEVVQGEILLIRSN